MSLPILTAAKCRSQRRPSWDSRHYLSPMQSRTSLQQALIWAVVLSLGPAVGTGLSSGDWLDAFLYAALLAPVTFLVMWALIDYKQKR